MTVRKLILNILDLKSLESLTAETTQTRKYALKEKCINEIQQKIKKQQVPKKTNVFERLELRQKIMQDKKNKVSMFYFWVLNLSRLLKLTTSNSLESDSQSLP